MRNFILIVIAVDFKVLSVAAVATVWHIDSFSVLS
jgi:hypothetical protein